MAIRELKYEIQEFSKNEAAYVQTPEEFVAGILKEEIRKRFMYEPMTEETARKIREFVRSEAPRGVYGTPDAEIDFMLDLRDKTKECAGCRGSGSYEEYKIKRAAAGLSDDAGSEKEWRRMANYSDGSVVVNLNFVMPGNAEPPRISFRIS